MYVQTITITRPNTDWPFWIRSDSVPPEWEEFIKDAIRRGLIISISDVDESVDDQLSFVRVFKYPNQEAFFAVQFEVLDNIAFCIVNRDAYEYEHGHIRVREFTVEKD